VALVCHERALSESSKSDGEPARRTIALVNPGLEITIRAHWSRDQRQSLLAIADVIRTSISRVTPP